MDAKVGIDAGRRQGSVSRTFTPATARVLAEAALAFSEDPFEGDDKIRNAVIVAVSEAHAAGWQGDELISAMRAAVPPEALAGKQREALEMTLKRRAMIAFFGANDAVF